MQYLASLAKRLNAEHSRYHHKAPNHMTQLHQSKGQSIKSGHIIGRLAPILPEGEMEIRATKASNGGLLTGL